MCRHQLRQLQWTTLLLQRHHRHRQLWHQPRRNPFNSNSNSNNRRDTTDTTRNRGQRFSTRRCLNQSYNNNQATKTHHLNKIRYLFIELHNYLHCLCQASVESVKSTPLGICRRLLTRVGRRRFTKGAMTSHRSSNNDIEGMNHGSDPEREEQQCDVQPKVSMEVTFEEHGERW